MAQALEAGTAILYAGTARQAGEAEPPSVGQWNWKDLEPDGHEYQVVNEALSDARAAEAGLLAGLIR